MKLVNMKTATTRDLPGRKMWMLLNPDEHDVESMSVLVVELPPGSAVKPPHSHSDAEEFIYISDGKGIITVDGQELALETGAAILVQKNEVHYLRNDENTPLQAICVFTPPSTPDNYTYYED